MAKRGRLEIIRDILRIIQNNRNKIKPTPLLRHSNVSSLRFKAYYNEILKKGFVREFLDKNQKFVSLTKKGELFLEKYNTIVNFIDEFEL